MRTGINCRHDDLSWHALKYRERGGFVMTASVMKNSRLAEPNEVVESRNSLNAVATIIENIKTQEVNVNMSAHNQ
jgi:hypothetical protein